MRRRNPWTLDDFKIGIDRFYLENGRFPTVSDLDCIDYLPSSRWIQMKFGGLVKVRKDLGYEDTKSKSLVKRLFIYKKGLDLGKTV